MSGIHFGQGHFHPVEIRRTPGRPAVPFARISAGWKAALLLGFILATVILPLRFWAWHLGVAVFLAIVVAAARIPWRAFFLRLLVVAPFIAGVALAAAFHPGAGPSWQTVAARGLLCVAAVTVFAAVTPLGELPGLLRQLKVPSLLVTTLALMHRYLSVLTAEAERMRRARASRTFSGGNGTTWLLSADVVGRLFVRASERAERIYLAMCARGWK